MFYIDTLCAILVLYHLSGSISFGMLSLKHMLAIDSKAAYLVLELELFSEKKSGQGKQNISKWQGGISFNGGKPLSKMFLCQ